MSRPEYVACAKLDTPERKTWCGRSSRAMEWMFTGADHALLAAQQGSRLMLCTECADAIGAALKKARYPGRKRKGEGT